jgi:L-lysine 2,3-aminomutase
LAINPTVLLIVFFIQALSKGTMEEILRQQIEKIVPLTDDEGFLVVSHFLVGNYKNINILFSSKSCSVCSFCCKRTAEIILHRQIKSHILQFAM